MARREQKNIALGGTGAEQGSRDTSRGAPGPKKIIFPTKVQAPNPSSSWFAPSGAGFS